MHKSLIALVGAAGVGLAAMAAPAPANAGCVGCAVGAGILGGVAVGAIVGSAIANSPPPPPPGYYPPPPGYYPPPPGAYGPPPPGAYGPPDGPPPPGATARLLRVPTRRRLLTRSLRPGAIGATVKSGSKATAIRCGPFRSVLDDRRRGV
jgi:hypothetical protein